MRLGESNPTTSPLYCFSVISYLSFYRPEADKVDFIIEENGRITRYVTEFYEAMPNVLTSLGKPEHKNLLGNLIPLVKVITHFKQLTSFVGSPGGRNSGYSTKQTNTATHDLLG